FCSVFKELSYYHVLKTKIIISSCPIVVKYFFKIIFSVSATFIILPSQYLIVNGFKQKNL
ncbi:hypothetical protein ABDH65_00910, partial [Heyndrickxia ginsengihumi]|uniref:hypothetical protein n=1 Tax=Heyndrickxia ginsengihumi TaxID=363870 RepID=UPI003D19B2D4